MDPFSTVGTKRIVTPREVLANHFTGAAETGVMASGALHSVGVGSTDGRRVIGAPFNIVVNALHGASGGLTLFGSWVEKVQMVEIAR